MQYQTPIDFWLNIMPKVIQLRDDTDLLWKYMDAVSNEDEEKIINCSKQVFDVSSNAQCDVLGDKEVLADLLVLLSGIQGTAEEVWEVVREELDNEGG